MPGLVVPHPDERAAICIEAALVGNLRGALREQRRGREMGHRGLLHDLKMIMRGHILEVDNGEAYNNAVATCTERTIISNRDIFAARVEGPITQPGVASELGVNRQAACQMSPRKKGSA